MFGILQFNLWQIVYIKDGRIKHQGTLQSIERADPQLASTWRETMQQELSESETETEDEKTMEERAKLMRTVSQQLEDEKKDKLHKLQKQGILWLNWFINLV